MRRKSPRKSSGLVLDHDSDGKSEGVPFEQKEGQDVQEDPSRGGDPLTTPVELVKCDLPHPEPTAAKATPMSETENIGAPPALCDESLPDPVGLQDDDQNSINKTPMSDREHIRSTVRGDVNQLITPSTSPASKSETRSDENKGDEAAPHKPALANKTKRRLNLHSSSYSGQPPQKKRRTPPKKQSAVQTTLSLSIGAGAGMKECKVCDTVYNPFHPEDVKVHAKRHAVVLKNGVRI